MPWCKDVNPSIEYIKKTVSVKQCELLVLSGTKTDRIQAANLGVKIFRNMIKWKSWKEDSQIFQILAVPNFTDEKRDSASNKKLWVNRDNKLVEILEEYSDVFKDELPQGRPPKKAGDHCIAVDENEKASHWGLF